MTTICPTVTAIDIPSFQQQLALVSSFADRIHIDIMDGDFTPTLSPALSEVIIDTNKTIDIHVMYRRPSNIINDIIALQPHMVIIHAEAEVDIPKFAADLRQHAIQTGLAVLPETQISDIAYVLPHVQHVLLFGGHLGYHGGTADMSQVTKVADIKQYAQSVSCGWDGGANEDNVRLLKEAGISVINVGSCIHSATDPSAQYQKLISLVS